MPVDRYVSTRSVTLLAGQTLALPHFLTANGAPALPTTVMPDRATEITCPAADTVNVTYHNPTAGPLTAVFIATFIHSINRAPTDMPDAPVLWQGANPVSPGGAGFALWSDATATNSDAIPHTDENVWHTFQDPITPGDQGITAPAGVNAGKDGTVLQIEASFDIPTEGEATAGYRFLVQGVPMITFLLGGGEAYSGVAYVQARLVYNNDGVIFNDATLHYLNELGGPPQAFAKILFPEEAAGIDPTLPIDIVAQVEFLDPLAPAYAATMKRLSARIFQGHPPVGP